jgi:hypothetical protein
MYFITHRKWRTNMEVTFRNVMAYAAIACSSLTGTVFAAQDLHSTDTDTDNQQQMITPNAGPRVQDGADVFLTADFIYWSVREEGLNFASTGLATGSIPVASLARGSTYNPGFTWQPGFKVGMGLQMAHDGWDIFAEYTWLNNPANSNTIVNSSSSGYELTPTVTMDPLFQFATVTSIDTAIGSWRSNFNTADLDLGRQYFISHYLILRPFAGLKASWQKQTYKVAYGTTTGSSVAFTSNTMRERFFGIGLRSGMDAAFQFDKNWSMYGDLALSALASHFNINETVKTYTATTTNGVVAETTAEYLNSTKAVCNTISPVLEVGMGLRWDYWFNDDSYHVGMALGWEQQVWFGMNRLTTIYYPATSGDLTMSGVTFKFRFDF